MQGGAAGESKKSPQYASQPQFNAVQILIRFSTNDFTRKTNILKAEIHILLCSRTPALTLQWPHFYAEIQMCVNKTKRNKENVTFLL